MFQSIFKTCWKHITHTPPKKKKKLILLISHSVGALRAFPPLACLLSSLLKRASLLLITLTFLPLCFTRHQSLPLSCPCSFFLSTFLSLFPASRFSASFQAGFRQLCGTSKSPSFCGLFRKDDNDIPNPADLQLISLFCHSSTIILRPQPPHRFLTSGCAGLISRCLGLLNRP